MRLIPLIGIEAEGFLLRRSITLPKRLFKRLSPKLDPLISSIIQEVFKEDSGFLIFFAIVSLIDFLIKKLSWIVFYILQKIFVGNELPLDGIVVSKILDLWGVCL